MSIPGAASPLFLATTAGAADAFEISRSLRFNSGDSAYLLKDFASAGNRRTWTWSGWVKRSKLGSIQVVLMATSHVGTTTAAFFKADDTLEFYDYQSGGYTSRLITSQVFRDTSSWFHLVVSWDTTKSTSSDRVKIYVNGSQITSFGTGTYPNQNIESRWNNNVTHDIGQENDNNYLDAYLAEVNFIDGQALAPTDFGETDANGVWQAKEYVSSGSPNAFGKIWSNDLTANTGFQSSYPAINAFDGIFTVNNSEGRAAANNAASVLTFSPTGGIAVNSKIEVYTRDGTITVNGGSGYSSSSSLAWKDVSSVSPSTPFTLTTLTVTGSSGNAGEIYAIRVDGTVLLNNAGWGINGFRLPFTDNSTTQALGYDQKETVTLNPKGGMDVVTYTGTGSARSIGGLAFQPDFVWIKERGSTGDHHLFDSVRGATKALRSNETDAEVTDANELTAFNSDGFSLGSGGDVNANGTTTVAWAWKAGGAAVSNTDGSLNSQVSANNDYGFSIVSYTGGRSSAGNNTVGHGLLSAPKLVITKSRASNSDWVIQSPLLSANKVLFFKDWAEYDISSGGSLSDPTSSVFSTNYFTGLDTSGDSLIAYCWSEVANFSKFSTYTGNGSTTGPVITTGFKVRFLLIKRTDASNNWRIIDTQRGAAELYPNLSNAEGAFDPLTYTADGFQIKVTDPNYNASGGTYIYAAFADRPGNNWTPNNLSAGIDLNATAKQNFDVVTYSGTGSTQAISGLKFQPDLVWIKVRNAGSSHRLFDSVRGAGKHLLSNGTSAEETHLTSLSGFTSDGFTLGANNEGATNVNQSSGTYVAWCWKAGGAAVSNTDGSITSSVSANADYGFSIVTYAGTGSNASVGHGLNAAPKFLIIKNRTDSENWFVWHGDFSIPARNGFYLDLTANVQNFGLSSFNDTVPSSSTITLGTNNILNGSGDNIVAYCWSEVAGFSKFGSYTGNGSTNGPTVTLGFKPRFILLRSTSGPRGWLIYDTERDTNSTNDNNLFPNTSGAENSDSSHNITILDDGFKLATTSVNRNGNGETYIYAAYAASIPGDPDNDSLVDSPSNAADPTDTGIGGEVVGNYATLNSLYTTSSGAVLSDGNLKFVTAGSNGNSAMSATIAVSSGKWYWEITPTNIGSGVAIGIAYASEQTTDYPGYPATSWSYRSNSTKMNNASSSSYGVSYTTGDVIGVALDLDNGTLAFYKNGASQGTAFTSLSGEFVPKIGDLGSSSTMIANFGQRAFAYAAPSGYKSLNTANLPTPTIADGSKFFDTTLWSGNATARSISTDFAPGFVWTKLRNTGNNHKLFDIVRGVEKRLESSTTNAEATESGTLTAFNSDGFSLGTAGNVNGNSYTYVGWAWAGGTSTVTNNDGSIASQVRAQPSAGFSIVKYVGTGSLATVGHSLNSAPELMIIKGLDDPLSWAVYANSPSNYLQFDTGASNSTDASNSWNGTAPTSSVFTVKTKATVNESGENYIAYCFAPVAGYSAIGSYTGNGSSDGPFVALSFRPSWVMIKRDGEGDWRIWDTSRDPINVADNKLYPNKSDAETGSSDTNEIDILSNGFKLRSGVSEGNASGGTYIYYAVAENPFQANGGLAR